MAKIETLIKELQVIGNDTDLVSALKSAPSESSCSDELLESILTSYVSLRKHASGNSDKSKNEYESKAKQMERANNLVNRERDRLQSDLNKQILMKDKLEDLCRTLQKEKKKIEEESNLRLKLEEAKRKEFADKVSDSINQLKQQISGNQEQQQQLCDENVKLTQQLEKSLEVSKHHETALEKYEERETTFTKLIAAKDEERAILVQKYDSAVNMLKEVHQAEIDKFKTQVDELLAQRKTIEDSFIEQAKTYDAKFTQMNSLVNDSQQTIIKYKKEMSEVTKFVSKLHTDALKSKDTIQRLAKDKTQLEQTNEALKKKLKALENLCRKLQSDRKTLVHICKCHDLSEEVERQLAASENEEPTEPETVQIKDKASESPAILVKVEENALVDDSTKDTEQVSSPIQEQ